LGYVLARRQIINQAARRAGAPEAALAAIDELGLLDACPSPAECRAYHRAMVQVMHEFRARGDVVLVGRAGQIILRNCPDTLHVRVIAPEAVRVARLVARHGISEQAARARIKASDQSRRRYVRRFYRARWDDPTLYDLVLNTAHMDEPAAVNLIVEAVGGLARARMEENGADCAS
jgi:cytidylate kinase